MIPKTNASLVEALADVNRPAGRMDDIVLKRRVYKTNTYGSTFAMSEVMGSVACIQNVGTGSTMYPDYSYHDGFNLNSGTIIDKRTMTPSNGGTIELGLTRSANMGDVGLLTRHVGLTPPSGTLRVQFDISQKYSQARPGVEVVASKTGWLEGGNVYLRTASNLGNGPHVFDMNVNPEYPYVTVTCQLILKNSSSSIQGSVVFKNIKAFML